MAKRKRFDIATAARGLYTQALARQDYSGAATALRLIRDLGAKGSTQEEDQARDLGYALDELILEEQQELRDIFRTFKLLANKVRQRLGRDQVPVPAHLFEPVRAPEPRVVHKQVYPPQPEPRAKDADVPAPPAKPIVIDPLDDYIAGENVEFGSPLEIE